MSFRCCLHLLLHVQPLAQISVSPSQQARFHPQPLSQVLQHERLLFQSRGSEDGYSGYLQVIRIQQAHVSYSPFKGDKQICANDITLCSKCSSVRCFEQKHIHFHSQHLSWQYELVTYCIPSETP